MCEMALDPDAACPDSLALARAALEATLMRVPDSQPHIDRLLQSLIKYLNIVPIDADAVHNYSELPSPWLKDVVLAAPGAGRSWRGWMDDRLHVWLFVAELALAPSRKLGAPVLEVKFYRENGLQESSYWAVDHQSNWRRCVVVFKSPQKPVSDRKPDEPTLTDIDFYRPDVARR
jgi:hypothetical protein